MEVWQTMVLDVVIRVTKVESESPLLLWARGNILDGAAKAIEDGGRTNMEKKVSDQKVDGMEGSFMTLSYDSEKYLFWHETLIFGKKGTLWWVDVIRSRRETDGFGEDIAAKVFEGIRGPK